MSLTVFFKSNKLAELKVNKPYEVFKPICPPENKRSGDAEEGSAVLFRVENKLTSIDLKVSLLR